ncbi:unnamed protein product [Cuscuta europaea]|uniref:Arginine decarboxylase n=1 Tax=Cuscuta europaea TaxID=41803 RepID=A0A9P0ZDJ3_CUSEU|nr:unnamed protein product [Cuscuta europaea]
MPVSKSGFPKVPETWKQRHRRAFSFSPLARFTALLADGVREAVQIYCELTRLGANMKVIDIGGGLGIDYDGSKSTDSDLAVGYTLQEYASAVVQHVGYVCDRKGVAHLVLCSETGRAIVSHHSVLIFEAVSSVNNKSSLHHQQNNLPNNVDHQFFLENTEYNTNNK